GGGHRGLEQGPGRAAGRVDGRPSRAGGAAAAAGAAARGRAGVGAGAAGRAGVLRAAPRRRGRTPGGGPGGRRGRVLGAGRVSVPALRGERAFFERRLGDQQHPVLLVREADGTERPLIDPSALSEDDTITLDDWVPSLEGGRLAYFLSQGGDEEASLFIMDVASGETIEGPIDRARYCPLAWLPGGDTYYYGRRLPADAVPEGEAAFHRRVWRHRVGDDPDGDQLVFGEGREKT